MPSVLITGGTGIIGRAIAASFASQNWKVGLASRDLVKATKCTASFESGAFLPLQIDGSYSSFQKAIGSMETLFQEPLGSFIHAAGCNEDALVVRLQSHQWERMLEVNLTQAIWGSKASLRSMVKQGGGSIVYLGSVVGSRGNTGQAAYSATKAGLIGMTTSLAKEYGSKGIRVNCVEPGFIESDMVNDSLSSIDQEKIKYMIALQRMGTATEVAEVVSFLAGPLASYITGQVIRVDGGLTM